MPQIRFDADKGLVQQQGNAVVLVPASPSTAADQTLTGNGQTISTLKPYVRVDPGAARNGIVLQAASETGKLLMLSNVGAAGRTITFAAANSNFSLDDVTLNPGESILCVWNGSVWTPTSQSLA